MKIIYVNSKKYGLKEVFVDDEDYESLIKYSWSVVKNRDNFYCVRNSKTLDGKKNTIFMHRSIMGINDSSIIVDHKDRNGINNQKTNLRVPTYSQNCMNRRPYKNKSSSYKGVSLWHDKNRGYRRWQARITVDRKTTVIGYFHTEIEAAIAYDRKASELHGDFASQNF